MVPQMFAERTIFVIILYMSAIPSQLLVAVLVTPRELGYLHDIVSYNAQQVCNIPHIQEIQHPGTLLVTFGTNIVYKIFHLF